MSNEKILQEGVINMTKTNKALQQEVDMYKIMVQRQAEEIRRLRGRIEGLAERLTLATQER